ncbi:MAG: EF-hand domain-containing protein [Roseovarius sp.]|nr:EF-hand domain-containing protein [Roseovarius sp.]
MKKTVLMTGLALAIGLGALSEARAQGMGQEGAGQGMMGYGMMGQGMMGQGMMAEGMMAEGLSMEDITARFGQADTDGDGLLGREELVARMTERAGARIAAHADRMIGRHDSDGDGMLSLEELQAGPAGRMFERLDADGDGTISPEEFATMREKFGAQKGRYGDGMHGHHGAGYQGHGDDRHGMGQGGDASQPGVVIHQHYYNR